LWLTTSPMSNNFWQKILNKSDSEKKTIMWVLVIIIALIVIIIWVVLISKGYIFESTESETTSEDANYGDLKSELKDTFDEIKEIDIKGKMNDVKQGYEEIQEITTDQQNEENNENNEDIEEPNIEQEQADQVDQNIEAEEQDNQDLETTNSSDKPRLPIE